MIALSLIGGVCIGVLITLTIVWLLRRRTQPSHNDSLSHTEQGGRTRRTSITQITPYRESKGTGLSMATNRVELDSSGSYHVSLTRSLENTTSPAASGSSAYRCPSSGY